MLRAVLFILLLLAVQLRLAACLGGVVGNARAAAAAAAAKQSPPVLKPPPPEVPVQVPEPVVEKGIGETGIGSAGETAIVVCPPGQILVQAGQDEGSKACVPT